MAQKFEDDQLEPYSEEGFWDKLKHYAKKAGKTVVETALKLYYASRDPDTPLWAKTTIYGALAYFISPLDAIPDILPLTGYTDDLGILAAAVTAVAAHIKPEHVEKAREQIKNWFG